ncbi:MULTISPECIES: hypothetical protein [Staphylococcus]|uniref:hypothetical protein n=1 Tax=Staphylococcus TaxID=1279 RepID=UPI0008A4C2B5|nr:MULTISPECIES: hypothetical protein [Staphylococcus]OFK74611.1 hypothetical protein HMPREF2802_06225 [Staphylococcus sp. HMSC071G07]
MNWKETNVKVQMNIKAELTVPVITKSTYDYDEEVNEEVERIFYKFVERPTLMEYEDLEFLDIDNVEIKDID